MTLNTHTNWSPRSASLVLAIFASLFYHPSLSRALEITGTLPAFADFSKSVQNGEATTLRGVYIDDVLALPIVQQPASNPAYVSNNDGEITEFGMAAQYGNTGLLAHNHLSGKLFSQLVTGQRVRLVYGDGRVESFVITEVYRYQALRPTSPYSSFRNLDDDREILTAGQMFKRAYLGDRHLTLQTCIQAYGNPSWGRLFIIAEPEPGLLSLDWTRMQTVQ